MRSYSQHWAAAVEYKRLSCCQHLRLWNADKAFFVEDCTCVQLASAALCFMRSLVRSCRKQSSGSEAYHTKAVCTFPTPYTQHTFNLSGCGLHVASSSSKTHAKHISFIFHSSFPCDAAQIKGLHLRSFIHDSWDASYFLGAQASSTFPWDVVFYVCFVLSFFFVFAWRYWGS